jgi:hypothetical protein
MSSVRVDPVPRFRSRLLGADARRRLPLEVIVRLVHQTAREIDDGCPDQWLWKKRRVLLGDGNTVSMPDTPRNQRVFPQSRSQGNGLGFPLAPLVVLISLASGVSCTTWHWGRTGERRRVKRRCFASF